MGDNNWQVKLCEGMPEVKLAQSVCDMCNGNCGGSCGINLFIKKDMLIKTSGRQGHPLSHGYICAKGRLIPEILNAPDRLRHPLKKDGKGRFREISWDEAFSLITRQLKDIKAKYGAESLAVHVGHAGVRKEFTPYVELFCRLFGTPNFSTSGSHCYLSKLIANEITCGGLPVPDLPNSKCIILWGYNPKESYPPVKRIINEARKKGAGLIVVDPRATSTARESDLHLQLRPGTDTALALGLINVIIGENLYDREFVDKWTIGFSELLQHIRQYPPEEVAKITWVPADKIRKAARMYASCKPASIASGIAPELLTNGFQAERAMSVLQAITGNLDIPGGAIFTPPPKLSPVLVETATEKPAIGKEEFPLFHKYTNRAQANLYPRAILEGRPYPIKGLIVVGSNPVLTWPDAGKVKRALGKLEFLAVMDLFLTETAKLADLVLPAATFWERDEIWDHSYIIGDPRLGMAQKALPVGDVMTDWAFWLELATRLGYGHEFSPKTEYEAINFRLKPLGLDFEQLAECPNGYIYQEKQYKKYEEEGFNTPSGKVEIYSKQLENHGYYPLPTYHEPGESPWSTPEIARDYPFILSTGARVLSYIHSRYRNLPSFRKRAYEPLVEMNRKTAEKLKIKDGELIAVESLRGRIELKAKLTEELHPQVIYVPHGWAEANVNLLTDDTVLDPVTGFPAFRALLARVRKINLSHHKSPAL
ncbi:molybdopterin-containing oxidoreductase family protein [Thermincola ferriacetica]